MVWSRDTAAADFAIVLEPEVPLAVAAHMILLAEVALGDSLGALCPPQVGVGYRWPGVILINGAEAGQVCAAVAPIDAGGGDTQLPAWLAIGVRVQLRPDRRDGEPGEKPNITCLDEEGCDLTRSQIIGSFARHFLTWLNIWTDDGFRPVRAAWSPRLFRPDGGAPAELDANGDLVIGGPAGPIDVLPLLARVAVYNPAAPS